MESIQSQVPAIRATLQAIEAQIASGKLHPEGLEDFKKAVDDVRLRVWAIMATGNMNDGPGALQRFRLRRMIDFIAQVRTDLEGNESLGRSRELEQVAEAAAGMIEAIRSSQQSTRNSAPSSN